MIYTCQAKFPSKWKGPNGEKTFMVKERTLSAKDFTDARVQFSQMGGGVEHSKISVACFNSETSFKARNKPVRF